MMLVGRLVGLAVSNAVIAVFNRVEHTASVGARMPKPLPVANTTRDAQSTKRATLRVH